jgi:hypothetical protein
MSHTIVHTTTHPTISTAYQVDLATNKFITPPPKEVSSFVKAHNPVRFCRSARQEWLDDGAPMPCIEWEGFSLDELLQSLEDRELA